MKQNRFYYLAKVSDINDPDDKGRCKVEIIENELVIDKWLQVITTFYSANDQGWHGLLAVDDVVRISFLDYPENQQPVIDGKLQSNNQSHTRDGKDRMHFFDHEIVFSAESINITHKDGNNILIDSDTITNTHKLGSKTTIDSTSIVAEHMAGSKTTIDATTIKAEHMAGNKITISPISIVTELVTGSMMTQMGGSFTFMNPVPFGDIVFGGLPLFSFLAGSTYVGNLGLPTVMSDSHISAISTAIGASSIVKIGLV